MSDPFELLCRHARETALLESTEALLAWDERTYLPAQAGRFRAEQLTNLAGMIHHRRTDSRIAEWLAAAEHQTSADLPPHDDRPATLRMMRRDFERRSKLPRALVEEIARQAVLGQQAWSTARKENQFAMFRPRLETMVRLQREMADAIGFVDHPYDALLDEYEPGETTSQVRTVLHELRAELVPLVQAITGSGVELPRHILSRTFPVSAQRQFVQQVAGELGFDFDRGRLDVTDHPFCSSTGPDDCRLTTRFDETYLPAALFGTLHEAGHGMYDQGLRGDQYGLPPGSYLSLGIHESQSRLWENLVGRSQAFWTRFFPIAQQRFPEALSDVDAVTLYRAVNDVRPSLIRVEADECTYNLHIIIRFELELALIEGNLDAADLPEAWNQRYQQYLGVTPASDADGVLQDIHWSAGLFGYFPTYTLGNLYASQLFEQAYQDLGDLPGRIEAGDFKSLLGWLREAVHQRGRNWSADELVRAVTGRPLGSSALMAHLHRRFGTLYELPA